MTSRQPPDFEPPDFEHADFEHADFKHAASGQAGFERVEAWTPFPYATGRGVRVGVIDSGVHASHPHISRVAGGVSVEADGGMDEGDWTDRVGHGTAVMAAIQEKAPAAEYFAVKVFHTSLRTSASSLLRAVDWCIEQNMDVVNLSLGSLNRTHARSFAEAAARAANAGTLLVAARDADQQPCYPGCLPSVFGVGVDWDCPRNRYTCEQNNEVAVFYASGYPRPVPGVPLAKNLHGISFAVANMTAFIVRACEANPGEQRGSDRMRVITELLIRESVP